MVTWGPFVNVPKSKRIQNLEIAIIKTEELEHLETEQNKCQKYPRRMVKHVPHHSLCSTDSKTGRMELDPNKRRSMALHS